MEASPYRGERGDHDGRMMSVTSMQGTRQNCLWRAYSARLALTWIT